MRIRESHLPQILLGLALLGALFWNLAYGAEVRWVQMDMTASATRAEIGLDAAGDYKIMRLPNPARLVVDFPASRLGARFALPPGMGAVRSVRHGQPVPGTVRIVFDLAADAPAAREPRLERGPDGVWLVIEWPGPAAAAAVTATASAAPAAAVPTPEADDTLAWPLGDPVDRIIIPGHAAPASGVPPPGALDPPPASLPPAPPASRPASGTPAAQVAPGAPPSPAPAHSATGPPPGPALDPIARIAAATQSGAAEQMLHHLAATPVAASVSPPAQAASAPAAVSPAPAPASRQAASPAPALRPLVIAIDPGHGGRDPGAIGPGGTHEKTIVMAIARELARQINAAPGMRAHLIRDSDTYVELPDRARLAREAKADMFVSIHADAAENRQVRGASVYTLSTNGASSQHARWLADRENSADLIGGVTVKNNDTLSSVLLDLAQSGHMKASQDAATHVLSGLSGVGKAHKQRVEYANFSVLRNADMPAMLVETGFISNPDEEKRLKDPAYQRKVAAAILKGIDAFFRNQPPPGTLFAARNGAKPVDASGGGQ